MKRYSFGTFLVDASNREAFDLCNRVAALRPVPVFPLVLLAPPEGGKTHLLYSIANRVKATRGGTALGFVRAGAFPEEVRRLVQDPGPIERARSAIFLIDEAEEFIEHVDVLEDVVRLFLEYGHAVVVASKLSPEYLVNLTPGLREMLSGGLLVRMGSYRTETVPVGSDAASLDEPWTGFAREAPPLGPHIPPATSERELPASDDTESLRSRIRELVSDLEHARADLALRRATEEDVERYRNAVEELKGRYQEAQQRIAALRNESTATSSPGIATLEADLAAAREAQAHDRERVQKLQRTLAQLQEELKRGGELETEIEYLKRELAVREQAYQEHGALQRELEAFRNEHTRVAAQFEDAAAARDRAIAELDEYRVASVQRQAEVEAERARKDNLLARMRSLLERVELRRRQVRKDDESQDRLLDEVEYLAAERVPLLVRVPGDVGTSESLELLLAEARQKAVQEWQGHREHLEQALQVTQDRANESAAECMRLQTAMEQHAAQVRDLQQTVSSLTSEKKKLSVQLNALRTERETSQQDRSKRDEECRHLQEEIGHIEQEHQELINTLEEQRIELEMTRIALDARNEEHDTREHARIQLTAERDSARAALELARAEHDRFRAQHKAAQRRLETALAELDALRHEAASQVAAAQAQAGELERRLAATHEQYHHSRHSGQAVAKDLRELEQRFLETAELVSRMSEKLNAVVERDSGQAESAYLYALTRGEDSEEAQLPLEMNPRDPAAGAENGDTGTRAPGNPYDDDKFIPFKPAEHKINRTV